MKREERNFVSYDYKEACVERERLSQYLDGYACFGWRIEREIGDAGAARVALHLKRDRHILNKAELTRLQRQFESCMDEARALEASKQHQATMAALCVGLAGTAFMAGSTFAVTASPPVVWLCVLLVIPGFLGWGGACRAYRRVLKRRAAQVEPLIEAKNDEIEEVCKKGTRLLAHI